MPLENWFELQASLDRTLTGATVAFMLVPFVNLAATRRQLIAPRGQARTEFRSVIEAPVQNGSNFDDANASGRLGSLL